MTPKIGDVVWAQLDGYECWPAKYVKNVSLPKDLFIENGQVPVKFYGSGDYGAVYLNKIFDFEKHFEEYSKNPRIRKSEKADFNEAILFASKSLDGRRKKTKRDEIESPLSPPKAPKTPKLKKEKETKEETKEDNKKEEKFEYQNVLDMRIELQRICLTEVQLDRLHIANDIVNKLENLEINYEILKTTNVGKLVKALANKKIVPDEYSIIDRCSSLLDKWIAKMYAIQKKDEKINE